MIQQSETYEHALLLLTSQQLGEFNDDFNAKPADKANTVVVYGWIMTTPTSSMTS